MSDDQFNKLFKYIQDFRTEVTTKLDQKASQDSVEHLINTIDTFVNVCSNGRVKYRRKLEFL